MEVAKSKRMAKSVQPLIEDLNLVPAHYSLAITHGWTLDRIRAADRDYRLFLQLVHEKPERAHVPSADADLLWHEHILTTELYVADCESLFGRYLHHYPFAGRFGRGDARRQRRRYEESQATVAEMHDGRAKPGRHD